MTSSITKGSSADWFNLYYIFTGLTKMFLYIIFLGIWLPATAVNITNVPTGVVVTKQPLHAAGAYVDVFVVVNDNREVNFVQQAESLLASLKEHIVAVSEHDSVKRVLLKRLHLLQQRLHVPATRQRRGLIDIIGDVSHILFGTARDSDIKRLNAALKVLDNKTNAIASAAGKTVAIIDKLSKAYNVLSQALNNVQRSVEWNSQVIEELSHELQSMEIFNRIDYLLSLLETQVTTYQNEIERVHDVRMTCLMGRVTDDVLPTHVLHDILSDVMNHKRLPDEWYYQALKVDYMFYHEDKLLCKILLPLVDEELFALYHVTTFPIMDSKGEKYIRLYHDVDVAISNINGDAIFADNCIGDNPIVCSAAARYAATEFQCLHGLIENDSGKLKHCPITYLDSVDPRFYIKDLGQNKYLGYSDELRYVYRCQNREPISGTISAGIYIIGLEQGCTLDTSTYLLKGLLYKTVDYESSPVEPRVIDLGFVDKFLSNLTLFSEKYPDVRQVTLADVFLDETLSLMPYPDMSKVDVSSTFPWRYITFTFCVITFLIVSTLVVFYLYQNRGCSYLNGTCIKQPATEELITPLPQVQDTADDPLDRLMNLYSSA